MKSGLHTDVHWTSRGGLMLIGLLFSPEAWWLLHKVQAANFSFGKSIFSLLFYRLKTLYRLNRFSCDVFVLNFIDGPSLSATTLLFLHSIVVENCCSNVENVNGNVIYTSKTSEPALQTFLGKSILKICIKFTGEHLCRSLTSTELCGFNKFAKQLYWNRTLAWMFSCKLPGYFQDTFLSEQIWTTMLLKAFVPSYHYVFPVIWINM